MKPFVGRSDDPCEREADAVADRVVGGGAASDAIRRRPEAGDVQRQPEEDEEEPLELKRDTIRREGLEEEEMVQAKAAGPAVQSAAPAAAAAVDAGGAPLSRADRAYFEPRFGRDLSHVRLHTDAAAGHAARDIGARAYTLRNHIAFAPGQFSPGTTEGRRLIAHELTHTFQQGIGTIRRLCTPNATCSAGPVQGSAEAFNEEQESQEEAGRRRRRGMSPALARSSGHAGRARQLETFFNARNPSLLGLAHGIFIDADINAGETAAYGFSCRSFLLGPPGRPDEASLPSGDPDPDGFATATKPCIFVPGQLNREALSFNRGGARFSDGRSRAQWETDTEALLTHEATHVHFEENIEPVLPRPAGVTTASCTDDAVEGELSEIVSMLSEFPFYFDDAHTEASPTGPEHVRLEEYFDLIMDTSGESLPGALLAMGCACECAEIDTYVIDRVDTMTAGFTADQKSTLRTELRTRMPSGRRPSWPNTPTR
jgi:hypothetical protein